MKLEGRQIDLWEAGIRARGKLIGVCVECRMGMYARFSIYPFWAYLIVGFSSVCYRILVRICLFLYSLLFGHTSLSLYRLYIITCSTAVCLLFTNLHFWHTLCEKYMYIFMYAFTNFMPDKRISPYLAYSPLYYDKLYSYLRIPCMPELHFLL